MMVYYFSLDTHMPQASDPQPLLHTESTRDFKTTNAWVLTPKDSAVNALEWDLNTETFKVVQVILMGS